MKDKQKILFIFGPGRKTKLDENSFKAKEFFYGFHYFTKSYTTEIIEVFKEHYDDPVIWFNRWRIFFLTCEVFFAMNKGNEYFVSHYLFEKTNS